MAPTADDRFEETIMPYLNDAYTLARYLLRDPHDAEDAVQDAALRAFRHFDGDRGGDPRTWFLTIVRDCCVMSWRRHGDDRTTVAFSHHCPSTSRAPRDTDGDAIAHSERAVIARALAALPMNCREVFVLREIHGLSYTQIGTVTRAPIGTVMSRLSRARSWLAAALALVVREQAQRVMDRGSRHISS